MKFLHHSVKPQVGLTAEESLPQTKSGFFLGLQSVKCVMGRPVSLRLVSPGSIGCGGGLPSTRDPGGRATAYAIPVRTAIMTRGRIVLTNCADTVGVIGAPDKYTFSDCRFWKGALV